MRQDDVVTLWHGTLDKNAAGIMKERLKPAVDSTYDFKIYTLFSGLRSLPSTKRAVYITENRWRAEWYAKFRKWYGEQTPGEHSYEWKSEDGYTDTYTVIKPEISSFPITTKTKPVVLKLEIPRKTFLDLGPKQGPQDRSFPSWRIYDEKIPARFIKEVIPVPVEVGM